MKKLCPRVFKKDVRFLGVSAKNKTLSFPHKLKFKSLGYKLFYKLTPSIPNSY